MSEFHQPIVTDAEHIDIDHIVDTIAAQSDSGPQFIHVGGVSSAGKSTVSRFIARELPDAQILSIDSYLVEGLGRGGHDFNDTPPDPTDPYIGGIDPKVWELDLLERHLRRLREGRAIQVPVFNETIKDREGYQPFEASRYVILEGGHSLTDRFRPFSSYNVLLKAPFHDRLIRKIVRTHVQYGRHDIDEVIGRYLAKDEPAWTVHEPGQTALANQIVNNPGDPQRDYAALPRIDIAPPKGDFHELVPRPRYGKLRMGELLGLELDGDSVDPRLRYIVDGNQLIHLPVDRGLLDALPSYYDLQQRDRGTFYARSDSNFLFQYTQEKIDKGYPKPEFTDLIEPGTYRHVAKGAANVQARTVEIGITGEEAGASVRVGFFFDAPFLPIRNGACYTLANLMRTLGQSGQVDAEFVNCYRGWDDLSQYHGQDFSATFICPEDYYNPTGILEHAVRSSNMDIAQFYGTEILVVGPMLKEMGVKIILEVQNIDHVLLERLGAPEEEINKAKELQAASLRLADFSFCRSDIDREQAIALGADPSRVGVYRGGICTGDFEFRSRTEDRKKLVFLGHMYYQPNENALDEIANNVLPNLDPDYTLTVIGITPKNILEKYKDNPRIKFREGVDDLSTELLSYDIALAPLQEGSGTRLKLLDYLASGLPVISTEIGAEGLDPGLHSHITVENDVRRYAQHIQDIAKNPQAYAERARAGRAFVEREYDWRACIGPFLEEYRRLTEKRA